MIQFYFIFIYSLVSGVFIPVWGELWVQSTGSQGNISSVWYPRQTFLSVSAIPGGAAQAYVSILLPVMGVSSTRHREVPGIFEWGREREDRCRGGGVVGAEAQFRVRGHDGKLRDARAAKNDDR